MNQQSFYKISESFAQILSKIKNQNQNVSRKELIKLAMDTNDLNENQASRLIDRNIYLLKKQGGVKAINLGNNRCYTFTENLLKSIYSPTDKSTYDLSFEQKTLKKEIVTTHYELQTYCEFLEKFPAEKHKITKFYKTASEKLDQLNGRLRAVNQLISL